MARHDGLVRWRKWKREVFDECPVASDDRKLCRMAICPCRRLKLYEMDKWLTGRLEPWFSVGAGRIGGMVRFGRLLNGRKGKDGNG